jgi:hypothetical protein
VKSKRKYDTLHSVSVIAKSQIETGIPRDPGGPHESE